MVAWKASNQVNARFFEVRHGERFLQSHSPFHDQAHLEEPLALMELLNVLLLRPVRAADRRIELRCASGANEIQELPVAVKGVPYEQGRRNVLGQNGIQETIGANTKGDE